MGGLRRQDCSAKGASVPGRGSHASKVPEWEGSLEEVLGSSNKSSSGRQKSGTPTGLTAPPEGRQRSGTPKGLTAPSDVRQKCGTATGATVRASSGNRPPQSRESTPSKRPMKSQHMPQNGRRTPRSEANVPAEPNKTQLSEGAGELL